MGDYKGMIEARPCQNIDDFAAELVAEAWRTNGMVQGRFNQYVLMARPGMTRQQVMGAWNEIQKQSYLKR